MDPNENVRQQNRLIVRIEALIADGCDWSEEREELADLQDALSGWLASGGFAPTETLLEAPEAEEQDFDDHNFGEAAF